MMREGFSSESPPDTKPSDQEIPLFHEPIAIIGIGCRLPGNICTPDGFWRSLIDGVDAITEVPSDRWSLRSFYDREQGKPGRSHACCGGFVEGIDRFDPHFFGISPREAARMDPQQRLLLEVAWEALEDGGQVQPQLSGTRVAVFVGISSWDYSLLQTSFRDRGTIDAYLNTGGTLSIAANRISYCFDFRGPSAAVDTACSSALVAVHLACRSIWVEKAPLALAGGVNALLAPDSFIGFSRMGMLSPDGRCKAFDSRANGFVRSEGAGIVVLKPLARAIADGDRIYAMIRGTAINQDGRTEGMTVPNRASQESLLREACRNAGVSPSAIQYIEAHGTGTPVGDPIESSAIGTVMGEGRPAEQACVIGSVKTNIGHLEAGSGIAGLIKTALALHHRQIPGNLHFEKPNPDIDFQKLKLHVPTKPEPWPSTIGPALAGVNSFGFGGTNAHIVMQGAPVQTPETAPAAAVPDSVLVPVSARSPEALRAVAGDLREFVSSIGPEITLNDIAANAAEHRTHHSHRLAVVAHSKEELSEAIAAYLAGTPSALVATGRLASGQPPRVAYVCSGQGPQWWAMGRQLLTTEPVFRAIIERCDTIVRNLGSWSLMEELSAEEARSRMSETAVSQPSIFAIQVALAALWESWGVKPEAAIGHSVGEVAAAYLAGVFSLEDAVRVIYHRGRCMDRASSLGRMLAVGLSGDEARRLIAERGNRVSLAALNAPNSTTLSGESKPLEEIAKLLEKRNIFSRFLQVNYAFHSGQMEPVREELLQSLKDIRPQKTRLPFFSTVTGKKIEGPELGPDYWWQNVRQTVRFAKGVDHLIELGCDTIVELSPHPVLTAAVSECYQHRGKKVTALPSLRRREDERATMLRTAAELHVHSQDLNWRNIIPGPRRFVRLPSYPWQRQRFWSESEESHNTRLTAPVHPLLGVRAESTRPEWEARVDLRQTPFLAAHRVQGVVILPATAYVENAFSVAREQFGHSSCQLEDVKLINPCFPQEDGAIWLRTSYSPDDSVVRIHTRPTGTAQRDWTAHFQVILRSREPEATSAFEVETVRQRCPRSFSRAACYDYFGKLGLNYGPSFQGIERCWQGNREALGEIAIPETAIDRGDDYVFHPALLDSCFQVVIAADSHFDHEVGELYLPVEIERVRLYQKPGKRLWSHARLLEMTDRRSVAGVDIYDEKGQLVATIQGLQSRKVTTAKRETLDDLLYAYKWVEKAIPNQPADTEAAPSSGAWLIFADRSGVGEQLAEMLISNGDESAIVVPGPAFVSNPGNRWQIQPDSREDMDRLLNEIRASLSFPVRGIVHLWALDATAVEKLRPSDLNRDEDTILMSALHLIQAWENTKTEEKPRLFLVTRGAQSVADTPEALEVAQAPLIGLGRVVINEFAPLRCRLLDLDPEMEGGEASSIHAELLSEDDEDEVAVRGSNRFVHRFASTQGEVPFTRNQGSLPPYRLTTKRTGTIDGLTLKAMHRTSPGPGEVELQVRAAGLNFSDVMKALGLYPGLPDGPVPFGAECSGTITALGEGVEGWAIGDEVIAVAPFAFSSHVITRAVFVARKPDHLSFEAAATIPIAFLTASYALDELAHLGPDERVLIHSATGGVGLAAIQLARRAGAEIFATAGSVEKRQYLDGLGIRHIMDSRSLAFADEVLKKTAGKGVDVILNSLAGEAISKGLSILTEYGRFLEIGKRDIYQNSRIGLLPFQRNLSFFAIDLDRVMRERPALLGQLLHKLVEEVRAGKLEPLPHSIFPVGEISEAFRFMQQGKHIGKVIVSMAEQPVQIDPGDDPVRFRSDATYLITGGLGGFGLATGHWMAERGAKSLVLVGRSGANSDEKHRAIAELEARGVRVTVAQADITSEEGTIRLLTTIARDLPPLRGVFHAAMVLEDSLLRNLDRDLMHRVLAPKVEGAWNLHLYTQHLPLDFFVLFSSLSSVFGHAGQANYAAANAFLDSLALYRRSRGLPCLTINWGHLGEVGYLAKRQELSERLTRQGVLSFTVDEAMTLLERALQRQSIQISVMRVDWSRWKGLGVTGRVSPRFAELLQKTTNSRDEATHGTSILANIQNATVEDRPAVLSSILREKLARVLGTSATETDWETSLLQLGIDSLMAVEVVNWIQAELGVAIPVVELMRSPGVSSLTQLLLGRFTGDSTALSDDSDVDEGGSRVFPLSQGQRALGFLHQMDPHSPALNLSFCSRVRSPIDRNAFRQAFQSLIDRHPALRTTFLERDGELLQEVHEHSEVALEFIDASVHSDEAIRHRLQEEIARPFDLEHGPLLRMHVFTRAPEDHIFLFTAHHIIGDFWSFVVIMEEMRTTYPAALAGKPPALPPPGCDYRQFVRWQSKRLAGAEGERLWTWWKKHLDGVPHVLELPTDRPRPPRFSHRGSSVVCRLDGQLTAQLKELATKEEVTLFAALLAGFQAFLSRYTGQDDFVVGSPFAGRPRREFEGIVGYFINMLPLRAKLSDDPSFRKLLHAVSTTVFDAFEYQEYPFSIIVERLGIERDQRRTPLIQASFTLEKAHKSGEIGASRFLLPQADFRMELGGLDTVPFSIEQRICQADLEMVLEENDGKVEGMLCYNTDLFDSQTAEHLASLYSSLLQEMAENPDEPLSHLSGLTAAEREKVLEEWNQTQVDFGPDECLHEKFARQAAATPHAIAIRRGERVVSYRELDGWANRIARTLRKRGVLPGSMVALCMDRSPEMVAAILGVIKAGCAYVPLDPDASLKRQQRMLGETNSPIVLTRQHLRERVPLAPVKVVCVEAEPALGDGETSPSECAVSPRDLAYVVYTSGSTGRPKGVAVEHAAICNTVRWRQQALPLRPHDRVLLSVPYHFDASIMIMFPPLLSGAQLVLAEPGEERKPSQLLSRIATDEVTVVQCLPSTLRFLMEEPEFQAKCRTVRQICCGGEPMPSQLPHKLFARLKTELFNLYGPTETAVEATYWQCSVEGEERVTPIGKPIANARVYVLDSHRQPVPIGVPGELYIGGSGVARGYLGDAELTATRFLPDPFVTNAGGRMFRSGDRARWRADGVLEILGRLDRQVKVSGYRIEPGEIEIALLEHPLVQDALVTSRQDPGGNQRLVAYTVARNGKGFLTGEMLRRHLGELLPRYMMPGSFVSLPMIPRTTAGKVDVRALPAPDLANLQQDRPVVGPRDRLEAFLAEVWSDLLNGENFDIDDNFFEMGGSSLQALMLMSRLRDKFGEHVATSTIFDSPTIAGLAKRLRKANAETTAHLFGPEADTNGTSLGHKNGSSHTNGNGHVNGIGMIADTAEDHDLLVPLQPDGSRPPLFLVHPPGGVVACYQTLAVHLGHDRPIYGIRSRGLYGNEELPSTLEDLAADYVKAVRAIQPKGPYYLCGWSLGGVFAYEMAQQLREQGEPIGLLALLDSTLPFGPTNAQYLEGIDESGQEFGLDLSLEELGALGPDEQLPFLWDHVKKLGLVPKDVPMEMAQEIIDDLKRLFHSHVSLVGEYTIRPCAGHIVLLRPSDSPVASTPPLDRGWSQLAETEVRFVPGQHHTMVKDPHVHVLARELLDCFKLGPFAFPAEHDKM